MHECTSHWYYGLIVSGSEKQAKGMPCYINACLAPPLRVKPVLKKLCDTEATLNTGFCCVTPGGAAEQVRQTRRPPNQCFDLDSIADPLFAGEKPAYIVCTDPCPHKRHGPDVKESRRDPRTSRF